MLVNQDFQLEVTENLGQSDLNEEREFIGTHNEYPGAGLTSGSTGSRSSNNGECHLALLCLRWLHSQAACQPRFIAYLFGNSSRKRDSTRHSKFSNCLSGTKSGTNHRGKVG